jgi:hypothetical protein
MGAPDTRATSKAIAAKESFIVGTLLPRSKWFVVAVFKDLDNKVV